MPRSPLPPREGISATTLRAPGGRATHAKAGHPVPETIGQWLREEFPDATEAQRRELLTTGSMCDEAGEPVAWDDPVTPGGFYFFHRPVPAEVRIPFDPVIVSEDEDLLVVDKPHFLASTPNGRFVRECVVTRLRVELGLPELVAIHRLDRITAGLLILSKRAETRGTYQRLFQDRQVVKTCRALAPLPPASLEFPREVRSRLVKPRGGRQVLEVEGEPNAHSRIRFLGPVEPPSPRRGAGSVSESPQVVGGSADADFPQADGGSAHAVGEYELAPVTGKTHQLRVHMASLGLPILGDPVYPVDLCPDPYDFSSPLQLLASAIDFTDPLSGKHRRFETTLRLG